MIGMLYEQSGRVLFQNDQKSVGLSDAEERFQCELDALNRAKESLIDNNRNGGRYGIEKDIWDTLTPEQRSGIASIYMYVNPSDALSEGFREIEETHHLSLELPDSAEK